MNEILKAFENTVLATNQNPTASVYIMQNGSFVKYATYTKEVALQVYDDIKSKAIVSVTDDITGEVLISNSDVKHAFWNEDGRCSNCDWYMPFDCEGNASATLYCPTCGAVMDKKQ